MKTKWIIAVVLGLLLITSITVIWRQAPTTIVISDSPTGSGRIRVVRTLLPGMFDSCWCRAEYIWTSSPHDRNYVWSSLSVFVDDNVIQNGSVEWKQDGSAIVRLGNRPTFRFHERNWNLYQGEGIEQ